MSSPEDRRRPSIEPSRNHETEDNRLAFLIAAALCVSAGLTGLSTGNPIGGYVALGMGALSAIGAIIR
jgi:hypothetical protein